jgi:divalent metal cation (Fe/Co/Zn/Cd) transporter
MTKEKRSIAITSALIKVAIVLCAAALFLMPYAAKMYEQISFQQDNVTVPLLITFYVCAAFGFVILFVLNKLIKNIGSEKVFIDENVKLLKILSYCCFAIAVVTLIFARFRILVFVITFAAAFIGLILRVIKNCFTEAIRLREENDFTI